MHNYHYIIASLPDLVADFSLKEFSYDKFSAMIKENLSERDRRIVAWFEYGLTPANLSRHFYREIGKLKCKFLSDYFAFDRNLRNLQVEFLASADQEKGDRYRVGETDRSIKELPEINLFKFHILRQHKVFLHKPQDRGSDKEFYPIPLRLWEKAYVASQRILEDYGIAEHLLKHNQNCLSCSAR